MGRRDPNLTKLDTLVRYLFASCDNIPNSNILQIALDKLIRNSNNPLIDVLESIPTNRDEATFYIVGIIQSCAEKYGLRISIDKLAWPEEELEDIREKIKNELREVCIDIEEARKLAEEFNDIINKRTNRR